MNTRKIPLLLLTAMVAVPAPATEPASIAIDNVTVIDGTGAAASSGQTVVISGNRIRSITPAAKADVPTHAQRIEGKDRFLLPGLIDMHAHIAWGPLHRTSVDGVPTLELRYDAATSRQLAEVMLHYGITAARNPGGPTRHAVAVRDALNSGKWAGPRLRTAGSVIDAAPFPGLGDRVQSVKAVREAVARQAAAGVDMVKLYASLPPEQVRAGIEAAHQAGLPAIGHLMATDWKQATAMGLDGIVHAMPASASLLPAAKRQAYRESIRGTQFMYQWFEYADLDGALMSATLDAMAERGVHFDPTLVAVEAIFFGDRERITNNPELARTPDGLLANWRGGMTLTLGWTDADFRRARAVFPSALELVRRAHQAGVTIVAGTDLGNPWIAPGTSLHRELELYVTAGLTPLEAIRTATANAADVLGMADTGVVEAGRRADLLLLDADPTVDIANLDDIALVMQGGRIVHDNRKETADE